MSHTHLENAHIRATIGADGSITSLVHKATGREALAGRGNQLWVYPADKPRNWDAWDIEDDYAKSGIELSRPESIKVVENTPTPRGGARRPALPRLDRHADLCARSQRHAARHRDRDRLARSPRACCAR